MLNLIKRTFPVGSPMWLVYRAFRKGFKPLAPGTVLHSNVMLERASALYFWVPKVACSTLKKVCADHLCLDVATVGGNDLGLAESVHLIDFPYVPKYDVRARYGHFYKFAFVRNPWDRVLSVYADKMRDAAAAYGAGGNRFVDFLKERGQYSPDMTFEAFVTIVTSIPDREAEGHLRSQASFLSDRDGLLPFDTIGRFETLADDFNVIAKRLDLAASLPHLRSSGKRDYREHYSSKMATMVRERYANDVTLFGYEF